MQKPTCTGTELHGENTERGSDARNAFLSFTTCRCTTPSVSTAPERERLNSEDGEGDDLQRRGAKASGEETSVANNN